MCTLRGHPSSLRLAFTTAYTRGIVTQRIPMYTNVSLSSYSMKYKAYSKAFLRQLDEACNYIMSIPPHTTPVNHPSAYKSDKTLWSCNHHHTECCVVAIVVHGGVGLFCECTDRIFGEGRRNICEGKIKFHSSTLLTTNGKEVRGWGVSFPTWQLSQTLGPTKPEMAKGEEELWCARSLNLLNMNHNEIAG